MRYTLSAAVTSHTAFTFSPRPSASAPKETAPTIATAAQTTADFRLPMAGLLEVLPATLPPTESPCTQWRRRWAAGGLQDPASSCATRAQVACDPSDGVIVSAAAKPVKLRVIDCRYTGS